MSKNNLPVTPATRYLKEKNIEYLPHFFDYDEKMGTKQTATDLQVNEHFVLKTIILSADNNEIVVVMHGDKEISTKELARILNVKKIEPASADVAHKATGYLFGGTSPYGTRKKMSIYLQETVQELKSVFINGGKRGFILEMTIEQFNKSADFIPVNVAIDK
jgi:Cys-tRNA(Pro) deacylase